MTQLPIPVHVGTEPLDHWDDIEARQRKFGEEAAPLLEEQRRPVVASPILDWAALGLEPRWVGFDTADCAAALQPSVYTPAGRGLVCEVQLAPYPDWFEKDRCGTAAKRSGEAPVPALSHGVQQLCDHDQLGEPAGRGIEQMCQLAV